MWGGGDMGDMKSLLGKSFSNRRQTQGTNAFKYMKEWY